MAESKRRNRFQFYICYTFFCQHPVAFGGKAATNSRYPGIISWHGYPNAFFSGIGMVHIKTNFYQAAKMIFRESLG
jgi:hypothetical protein